MDAKKVAKRTKVKPFVKLVNYNHLMPTRYSFDVESFKSSVTSESLEEPTQREEAKKVVKRLLKKNTKLVRTNGSSKNYTSKKTKNAPGLCVLKEYICIV